MPACHTNAKYSTVEADGIPHGVCTHLQYELHSGLKGLWVGVSILLYYVTLDTVGGVKKSMLPGVYVVTDSSRCLQEQRHLTQAHKTVAAATCRVHAAYLHAHDGHSEVGSSQVNSQSTLRFQDVIDVLREGVLHRGETESLLKGLVQVDGT